MIGDDCEIAIADTGIGIPKDRSTFRLRLPIKQAAT